MAECIKCGNLWKPPYQYENNKTLMENSKCPKCGWPALDETVMIPIGSEADTSYEEWKSDHIDDYSQYKKDKK